ncbi:hypothetical protein MATL_G00229970 [Megalops atlanticus]|uniref:Apolipoprotein C-III n=1 Tax=Megalops atlanticus TaxID=7932 RepID=A0A9D3PGR1_MEGAT|nr:hypothetical protein MATL_G00229970 [Megalops atlanticus]
MLRNTDMSGKLRILTLVLVLQACLTTSADAQEGEDDSTGILDMAGEAYRTAVEKVQTAGKAVKGFAESSYQDHVKPIIDPSITWATETVALVWEKVKTKLEDFWSSQ